MLSHAPAGVGSGAGAVLAAQKPSGLKPECEALVVLAEPGDVYAHYNAAMSAAAVSHPDQGHRAEAGPQGERCPGLLASPAVTCLSWELGMMSRMKQDSSV